MYICIAGKLELKHTLNKFNNRERLDTDSVHGNGDGNLPKILICIPYVGR